MLGQWMADRPAGDLLDLLAPHLGHCGGLLFRDPALRHGVPGTRSPAFERYQALHFRFGRSRIDPLLVARAERILRHRDFPPLVEAERYEVERAARIRKAHEAARAQRAKHAAEMANLSVGSNQRVSINRHPGTPIRIEDAAKTMDAAAAALDAAPLPLSWRCSCGRLNNQAIRCGHAAPWEA